MSQDILGILRDLNVKIFETEVNKDKAQLIFNYIDISFHNSNPNIEDLYVKAKAYIKLTTESFLEGNIYYDHINVETFYKIIFKFPLEYQKHLFNYLRHTFRSHNLDEFNNDIDNTINKVEYRFSLEELKKKSFKSLMNYLLCAMRYNYLSVLISLFLCFLLTYIVTLPWENAPFHLFEIKSLKLSDNGYFNHFANLLLMIFDLSDDKYIIPISIYGAIVLVLLKLFNVFIIFGYLWKLFQIKLHH